MGDVAMDLMSDDKQTMMKNKNAMRYEHAQHRIYIYI
jgi:hypothetical protein